MYVYQNLFFIILSYVISTVDGQDNGNAFVRNKINNDWQMVKGNYEEDKHVTAYVMII